MLCCIFNYAPHYRLPIFQKIAQAFKADFYFGEKLQNGEVIKKLDYSELTGFKKELKVSFWHLPIFKEWTSGWIKLAFSKKYDKFLITPNICALNQWIFLLVCLIMRKKVYCWEHGIKSKKIKKRTLIRQRFYHSLLSGTFTYGDKARKNMTDLGFNPEKLHTIYNSLDYDKSIEIRKEMKPTNIYREHFMNNYPTLLFIGRLTAVKKLNMILQADKILQDNGINVNFVFIGDGPEKGYLETMTSRLNCKTRCWFCGALYDEWKIAEFLYNADVCLSPGNVGLTAMHAMSYGLPVITNNNFETQMPEHEAITEGITGAFFQEDDINDFAKSIQIWLTVNNKNREQVRKNCYNVIDSKFNPNNQIRIFKSVIGV